MAALASDVLGRGVPLRFKAGGHSMAPLIRDGDVVTISPLSARPRIGDVVAYLDVGGRLVVHRVAARRGELYEIRADGLDDSSDLVAADHVLGVVTRVERRGRDVRLGLGPERLLIAGLQRLGLYRPIVGAARAARARRGPGAAK